MGAQEDYERISGFAEELGLEDDEKDEFVNSAMKRKGYRPRMAWDDPEPEKKDEGDFFSKRRQSAEKDDKPQRRGQYG